MPMALMEMVATERTIEEAREKLHLTYTDVGRALGTTLRTVERWRGHKSSPSADSRESIEQLRELLYWLDTIFETPDDAMDWLTRQLPGLRGRTPISYIRRGDLERINEILATYEAGAFI